jgi:Ca2+-binding EF-hand superfamily protein
LLASFDRDGDLLVSAAELEAGIAREFARADANHDHVVDPAEYQAWSLRALGGLYAPFRQDIDRNANGQITFDEFAAELRARAQRYDSNGDGVIEHADLVRQQSNSDDELQLLTPQRGVSGGVDNGGPSRRRH